MKTYSISFAHSRDGKSWNRTSTSVKAETQSDAFSQIRSKYNYVKDLRVMSVR